MRERERERERERDTEGVNGGGEASRQTDGGVHVFSPKQPYQIVNRL